jgi:nicotinamide-nucleotide amidase
MMMPDTENGIERALAEKAQPLVDALRQKHLSAVTAESCTASLVAANLSHAPHAGECLHGGYVVYSKEHKSAALGVDAALLRSRGSMNANASAVK